MINPAARKAASVLDRSPGLSTGQLLDAIPAAGREIIAALHRDGHRYGYGQDVDGRWWLRRDNPKIDQSLKRGALTPMHHHFLDAQQQGGGARFQEAG